MRISIQLFSYFLGIAFLVTACNANDGDTTATEASAPAPLPNTPPAATENRTPQMPQFAMLNAAGQTIDLKSFAGKKVFVNLWATWCPPCRSEMPSIEKLYASVDTSKTAFVMLSLDDDFEKAKTYIAENKMSLPVYYPQGGQQPELFNVRGIPATFIFDEKGQLMKSREGSDDYDTEAYRQLLKQ